MTIKVIHKSIFPLKMKSFVIFRFSLLICLIFFVTSCLTPDPQKNKLKKENLLNKKYNNFSTLKSNYSKQNIIKVKNNNDRIRDLETQLTIRVSTIQDLANKIRQLRKSLLRKDLEVDLLKESHQNPEILKEKLKSYGKLIQQYEKGKESIKDKNRVISELEKKLYQEVSLSKDLRVEIQNLKLLMQSKVDATNSLKGFKQKITVLKDEIKGYGNLIKQYEKSKKSFEAKNQLILELEKKLNHDASLSKDLKNEIQDLKTLMQTKMVEINTLKISQKKIAVLKDEIKGYGNLIKQYEEGKENIAKKNQLISLLENKLYQETYLLNDLKSEIQNLKDLMEIQVNEIDSLKKSYPKIATLEKAVKRYDNLIQQNEIRKKNADRKNQVISELKNNLNLERTLSGDLKIEVQNYKNLIDSKNDEINSLKDSYQKITTLKHKKYDYNNLNKQYEEAKGNIERMNHMVLESDDKQNQKISLSFDLKREIQKLKTLMQSQTAEINSLKASKKKITILKDKIYNYENSNKYYENTKAGIKDKNLIILKSNDKPNENFSLSKDLKDDIQELKSLMQSQMADINSLKEPYQKMATFDEKVNGSDKLTKQNKESIKNQNVTISKIDKSMNQDISLIDLKRKAKQLALKVNSLLIEVKTAGSPLLIRRDASLKSPVVGKLKNGTKVPIKKRTENWFKIEFNSGRFGWVNRKYAVVISDKENK